MSLIICKLKFLMVFGILLISGCQNKINGVRNHGQLLKNAQGISSPVSNEINNIEKIERCRRELDALKKVDVNIYNKRKSEFDKLMSDAVIYNGVRVDVKEYTQGTVDALYRFRVNKLCADISSDILNKLTE